MKALITTPSGTGSTLGRRRTAYFRRGPLTRDDTPPMTRPSASNNSGATTFDICGSHLPTFDSLQEWWNDKDKPGGDRHPHSKLREVARDLAGNISQRRWWL